MSRRPNNELRRTAGDQMAHQGKRPDVHRLPRDRYDRGESRRWFCRTCGAREEGMSVPAGWYLLARVLDEPPQPRGRPHQRLGMYCSIRCVAMQLPRLANIEADLLSADVEADLADESADIIEALTPQPPPTARAATHLDFSGGA